jgi:hypothetical protein
LYECGCIVQGKKKTLHRCEGHGPCSQPAQAEAGISAFAADLSLNKPSYQRSEAGRSIEAAKRHLLAVERAGIEKGLEMAAQIVEKAFEQNWVVQDTLDSIRAARKETL